MPLLTRRSLRALTAVLALCWVTAAPARVALEGFPGALLTPTARMAPSGQFALNMARHQPYSTLTLSAQVFPWLHGAIRYVSIDDRPYGPGIDQSYKDKGFDFALRLWPELGYRPAAVVGLVDVGGTGLFGSEYFALSKRLGAFDVALGLGWGRLGAAGDFSNPLAELDERFAERADFDEVEGGEFNVDEWFSGDQVAVFGSLRWQPPGSRWSLLLEWDGNDYDERGLDPQRPDAEPAAGPVAAPSRLNAGVAWQPTPWLDLKLAYIRGDTLAGQVLLHSLWGRETVRDREHQLPVWEPLLPAAYRSTPPQAIAAARKQAIVDELWHWRIFPHAISLDDDQVTLRVSSRWSIDAQENALATARIALSRLPEAVQYARVIEVRGGLPAAESTWDRTQVDAHARREAPIEALALAPPARQPAAAPLLAFPVYSWRINPALRSNIGGAGGFFLTDLQVKPAATVQFSPRLALTGGLALRVFGNLDETIQLSSGTLPRVRSDIERYQREGSDLYLERLELNWNTQLARAWYGRLSGGIFEGMYGGVAAEVLWYRPERSWALGLNINRVRQREFEQGFGFRDYEVTTGHLTAYWDTPWSGVHVEASAGRYLAGDVGATLRLGRRFANGFEVGGFVTKTDVSAEEFGEGSFDKGIFFRVPLTVFDDWGRPESVGIDYRFLSRDGGQKVDDGRPLYPTLRRRGWQ